MFVISQVEYDALPDSLKAKYVAKDGAYHLKIEGEIPGFVPKQKLDEFRENNVKLMKQMEDLEKAGLKLSPEQKAEYDRMVEEARKIKDKELIDAGKIDELVQQRTERMRAENDARYNALLAKNQELEQGLQGATGKLHNVLIESELVKSITSVGAIRKGAMTDIVNRARAQWLLKDGNLVAMNGDSPVYGKDGKTPMSMQEWCQSLAESAPYLFESSSGGGASGGQGQGGSQVSVVPGGDNKSFITNLDAIASGKAVVQGTSS